MTRIIMIRDDADLLLFFEGRQVPTVLKKTFTHRHDYGLLCELCLMSFPLPRILIAMNTDFVAESANPYDGGRLTGFCGKN